MEARACPHGRGLFAIRDIPSKFVIAEFEDVPFTSNPVSPPERGHALRVAKNEYWDEAPPDSPWYWSNFIDHSGTPNSKFTFDRRKRLAWLSTTAQSEGAKSFF